MEDNAKYEFETGFVQRGLKKVLRVTFPDGKVLCYKSITLTFVETLRNIGVERLQEINLELCHLPLIAKEIYPKYKQWMKPLDDGWYVNTQSTSEQKYLQLKSITKQLDLDIKIEIGENIKPSPVKSFQRTGDKGRVLLIKTPDGSFIGGESPMEVYKETLKWIGLDMLKQKQIELEGKKVVTAYQLYKSQVEIEKGTWLTIPSDTNKKIKALRVLKALLRIDLEINVI